MGRAMAHEIDGKDIRPDALGEGRSEKHPAPSEGTEQDSTENDKDYRFLKDLVRYARLVISNNSPAIFEKLGAKSVEGSIQHLKMLFGVAGVKDVSKLSDEGKTLSAPFLTHRLFHEIIKLQSEPAPNGGEPKPDEPPPGRSEDQPPDRSQRDAGSNL